MAEFENEIQNLQRHERQVEKMGKGAEFSCSPKSCLLCSVH